MLLTKFRSPVWWHSYQRILANLLRLKISLNNGQSKHTWSSLHSMCSCRYYLSNISNISINKFNRWSAGCNRIWTHFLFVILYLILQSLVGRFIKRSKENSHFWTLWNPNVHGLAAAKRQSELQFLQPMLAIDEVTVKAGLMKFRCGSCLLFLVHVNVLWGQSHQTCTGTIFVCFVVPVQVWCI